MALPTLVIVGAGAAGVFTAYEISQTFPNRYAIRLLEAGSTIGGNVSSVSVTYGGNQYVIDAGAQFFSADAQPNYVKLIEKLGLTVTPYAAGIMVWDRATSTRLLWIPSTPGGFLSPDYTAADVLQFLEFFGFVTAATLYLRDDDGWSVSVDEFIAKRFPLRTAKFENMVKSFLYQFVSLPYEKIGTASAGYAVSYFLRSMTVNVSNATFLVGQSLGGLLSILQTALTRAGVSAETNTPVTSVAPGSGGVTVMAKGEPPITADHVVMACDPGTSADLLAAGGTANPDLIALLKGLGNEYLPIKVVMQKDGQCWMPGDPNLEAVSTVVDTNRQSVAFSAWFGPLRPPYGDNRLIPVYKSWGSPDLDPATCPRQFFTHTHNVLLPTVSFVKNRDSLAPYQGQNRLFFAGGWTNWFDSQEAALTSAMNVVKGLGSTATAAADRSPAAPGASAIVANVRAWGERIARQAPAAEQPKFADLLNRLA